MGFLKLSSFLYVCMRKFHFVDNITENILKCFILLFDIQSFCAALHEELTEYYRLIAVLEGQVYSFFVKQ